MRRHIGAPECPGERPAAKAVLNWGIQFSGLKATAPSVSCASRGTSKGGVPADVLCGG